MNGHTESHQDAVRALGELAQREQGVVVLQDDFPRAVGAHHGVEQEGRGQVISECLRVRVRGWRVVVVGVGAGTVNAKF